MRVEITPVVSRRRILLELVSKLTNFVFLRCFIQIKFKCVYVQCGREVWKAGVKEFLIT